LEKLALKAKVRETTGNGPARVLRRAGLVPAVLYGPASETTPLSVDAHEFENLIKQRNINQILFNLNIENGQNAKAIMIKELQTHPVSQDVLHIDFYKVNMKRKIRVNVPVVTTGKSAGVEMGGVLQIVRRELEVLCLPIDIPEAITIDISNLNMGDSVHVNDIPLDEDVEIPADVNFTILTVVSPKVDKVLEEEEELAAEEAAAEAAEEAAEDAVDDGKDQS
jgi:large subunit ribosomal protein L25